MVSFPEFFKSECENNMDTNVTAKMLEFVLSELSDLGSHDFSVSKLFF